eukprot:2875450-Amphidinium_carterae.1
MQEKASQAFGVCVCPHWPRLEFISECHQSTNLAKSNGGFVEACIVHVGVEHSSGQNAIT